MKHRIGIVLSVVWLLGVLIICLLEAEVGYDNEILRVSLFLSKVNDLIPAYIGFGVLPVAVGWGVWWIWKGRAKTKPGKDS
jgi:hypothetical protein